MRLRKPTPDVRPTSRATELKAIWSRPAGKPTARETEGTDRMTSLSTPSTRSRSQASVSTSISNSSVVAAFANSPCTRYENRNSRGFCGANSLPAKSKGTTLLSPEASASMRKAGDEPSRLLTSSKTSSICKGIAVWLVTLRVRPPSAMTACAIWMRSSAKARTSVLAIAPSAGPIGTAKTAETGATRRRAPTSSRWLKSAVKSTASRPSSSIFRKPARSSAKS